ncbi:zinc finger protein 436-like isoform X2 [Embiotoca jacksoni]|uniref:zinc finger protein 436-like isoform X2 n=1 Tax=Embiotoca jacksoni TaxID=100190 RepID=UPI0037040C81
MTGNTAERDMSKAEVLRGFVTERLAAAAREILAAVERTVAGYEEEASGFRLEIDRQRSQLELLQPRVAPSTAGTKCSRSLDAAEEEDEKSQELLENLDLAGPSRFLKRSLHPRCRDRRRKPGRPQISETENHVDLRIRILEDSQTSVLSKKVLKKCPISKLKCPRGLQEADFLDLLRSTFPPLAGDDKPFDVLTSDQRGRLRRLKLKTVTPEEVRRHIGCTAGGKSTVYIRLQTAEEHLAKEEEIHPPQTKNVNSAVSTCDATRKQTRNPDQELQIRRAESCSSTSQQDIQPEEDDDDDDEEPAVDFVERSTTERGGGGSDADETNCSDDNRKPERSEEEVKERDSERQSKRRRVSQAENSAAAVSCEVCGALHKSEVSLVKHAWSHADDPGSVCGACAERSESEEMLKDHLQSRHRISDCHVCGESFLSGLNDHVAARSGQRLHKCDVCNGASASKESLEDHQKLHAMGRPHKCYTCHKVFELKEQLKTHRRTHGGGKAHLCGVCGKSLSDYRSLSRHKMTHSGERPHSCQICGRCFKLPGTLRQHEKIHTDRERSYLCDVCCKMFLTIQQLQIHMRTHTNEKPYHCGECGKGFTTKGPLTVHMRVHTGEKPYRCPDCGWSFKRKTNLDDHVAVHSGVKPFVCGICGKACARKTHLTVHMRTHNGERPYKCSLCDKAFTQSHCLKTHMKSHQGAEPST